MSRAQALSWDELEPFRWVLVLLDVDVGLRLIGRQDILVHILFLIFLPAESNERLRVVEPQTGRVRY